MKKFILSTFLLVIGLIGSARAQTQLTGSLTNGLVAYYPFHGNGLDMSGNANNINTTGYQFTADQFGVTSNAINFSSVSSLQIPNSSSWDDPTFTVSAWVQVINFDPSNNWPFISGKRADYSSGAARWELRTDINNSSITGWCFGGSFSYSYVGADYATNQPSKFSWNHICGTFNGKTLSLYINGILVSQSSPNQVPMSGLSNPIQIGGATKDVGNSWCGALNCYRYYNRALSSAEVAALYTQESHPPLAITSRPTDVTLTTINSQTATFSVVVTNGVPPYAYQWMKDGVDLTNQTNASLVLSNAAANTVGYYSCDVTDQNGTTLTSSNAALNITGVDFNLWQGLVAYYNLGLM